MPDKELIYNDNGFIILSDQYTEKGNPTRLVIICHGAGSPIAMRSYVSAYHYCMANKF